MHEFSLAQGLHDQLMELAREHDADHIIKAEVLVGDNAGIVVESFVFGCNVLIEQFDVTRGMELVITRDDGGDLMLMRVEFGD